jgi:hypothetical protein
MPQAEYSPAPNLPTSAALFNFLGFVLQDAGRDPGNADLNPRPHGVVVGMDLIVLILVFFSIHSAVRSINIIR